MCFCVFRNQSLPREAMENIECYKVVQKQNIFEWLMGSWRSKIMGHRYFKWKTNPKLQLIPLPVDREFNQYISATIEIGYHSFRSTQCFLGYSSTASQLIKCIIPKGSVFYQNDDEYISSNLKIIGNVKNP